MDNVKYICKASNDVKDLTGEGMEYLLGMDGEVIAVFIDGMMNGRTVCGNVPISKTIAEMPTLAIAA